MFYNDLDTWIPRGGSLPLQNSPIKVIQLNINIFQKTNGTGNFQNTTQDRQILIDLINQINQIYSSIVPSSDPYAWVVDLPNNDSKIRFDIGPPGNERIYFYQNDALNISYSFSTLLNAVSSADPNRLNQFNILFTEAYYNAHVDPNITVTNGGSGYTSPPTVVFSPSGAKATAHISNGQVVSITLNTDANGDYINGLYYGGINSVTITLSGGGGTGVTATCFLSQGANGLAYYPSYNNLNADQSVMMLYNWSGYRTASAIAHEIGHNFNLIHPFQTDYCSSPDYLSDVYGSTPPGICPLIDLAWEIDPFLVNGDGITNNLMCSGPVQKYLSPMQVGIIHRSLALTSVRKYVVDCYSPVPLVISNSQIWDFDMRLYRDIIINSGGEISFNCKTLMPASGSIIVNNGGKAVLNGTLSTNSSQSWQGIVVNNGGVVELLNSTISNYIITVKNGGTLKIPSDAIISVNNNCRIEIESGGYICIESGASINLQDYLSVINLRTGYLIGVNPSVPGLSGNCISAPASYSITGNGSINTFNANNYVQNQTFTISDYLSGFNIFAGTNVTPTKPQGPIKIQNGAEVVFDADGDVELFQDFEVQFGSGFEAK